ncbi:MAG: rod-binding protein [Acidobacteriota bacterium]
MGAGMTGVTALAAQNSLQQTRDSRILKQVQQLQSEQGTADKSKIEKGAKDFEAMLLSSWLQQAEQSFATVPGADSDDDDAAGRDQMMSFGTQALAQSMANSGGIGIGKMIAQAMERTAAKAELAGSAPAEGKIEGKK